MNNYTPLVFRVSHLTFGCARATDAKPTACHQLSWLIALKLSHLKEEMQVIWMKFSAKRHIDAIERPKEKLW